MEWWPAPSRLADVEAQFSRGPVFNNVYITSFCRHLKVLQLLTASDLSPIQVYFYANKTIHQMSTQIHFEIFDEKVPRKMGECLFDS